MTQHQDCHVEPLEKPLDLTTLSTATAAYLAVWGMNCSRCAMRVRNGLLSLEDVLFVEVFLEKGLAIVAYQPGQVTTDDLVGAVAAAGRDSHHHYRARVVVEAPATQVLWG